MPWDSVNDKLPQTRSKPLSGYRVLSSDRGGHRDQNLGIIVGEELKRTIKRAAKGNRRNMSEEVISILTWYYTEFGEGVVYDRKER